MRKHILSICLLVAVLVATIGAIAIFSLGRTLRGNYAKLSDVPYIGVLFEDVTTRQPVYSAVSFTPHGTVQATVVGQGDPTELMKSLSCFELQTFDDGGDVFNGILEGIPLAGRPDFEFSQDDNWFTGFGSNELPLDVESIKGAIDDSTGYFLIQLVVQDVDRAANGRPAMNRPAGGSNDGVGRENDVPPKSE